MSSINKTTIIGLGLVGNSIGMGLKKAFAGSQAPRLVGFDPDRAREEAALRTYFSVDEIAPDLESAVRGARLVIISTPTSAAREVLEAISPFLDEGATVTDTLSTKEQVMAWAGELLGGRVGFVGGHPLSRLVDLESAADSDTPRADLFLKAPYCILPLPSAGGEALNTVISLAQALGAQPLFIDPHEHDSFFAAASHLPVLVSAALLRATSSSPSWQDISALARGQFASVAEPLSTDPGALYGSLAANRQTLVHWLDQYLLALREMRDLLAAGNGEALLSTLQAAHEARARWIAKDRATGESDPHSARLPDMDDKLRADIQEALEDSKPGKRILGKYLTDRMFGKKNQ